MNPATRLEALSELASRARGELGMPIQAAARELVATVERLGTVYVCGNGGSMAQAIHLAGELTGRYRRPRRPLACVVLGTDPAHATCVTNDFGANQVFARHLEAFAQPVDALVCLTTSGRSPNVRAAAEVARARCMRVVAITGAGPESRWWAPCSTHVAIPSEDTALVQELTLSVLHSICEHLDEVFGEGGRRG